MSDRNARNKAQQRRPDRVRGVADKVIRQVTDYRISDRALLTLRGIVQVSMLINVFLLANEIFKEFYTRTSHVASSKYLFFGLHGHHALVPWIWAAISFNFISMALLVLPLRAR